MRRIEDITKALRGTQVGPGTVSNLNRSIFAQIGPWRNASITEVFPYVHLDGFVLK